VDQDSFSDDGDGMDKMRYGGNLSEVDEVKNKNELQRMIKAGLKALNWLKMALEMLLAG
jgi:hypothetical protein